MEFADALNAVFKYGQAPLPDIKALTEEAVRSDKEDTAKGDWRQPNNAIGMLADLLDDNDDPRSIILRREQEHRTEAQKNGIPAFDARDHFVAKHFGLASFSPSNRPLEVTTDPYKQHIFSDGSHIEISTHTHTPSGKKAHAVGWYVPYSDDKRHRYAAILTDEELHRVLQLK